MNGHKLQLEILKMMQLKNKSSLIKLMMLME